MADETPNDEREGAETPEETPEQQPPAPTPEAAEPAAPEEPVTAEAPTAEGEQEPAAAPAAAETPAASEEEDEEEVAETPRVKPEIPGADLELDLVAEGEDPLARAEAEEAEAAALAAAEEEELADQPIASVAIDLAAGARYRATGKRKTAVARVTLRPGSGEYSINGRPLAQFFPRGTLQRNIRQPLETVGYETRMDVVARLHGGGVSAQAGALRHGISRALLEADPNLRGELKRRGFLTRDARAKERKKAGLKKARKRPQFSKR